MVYKVGWFQLTSSPWLRCSAGLKIPIHVNSWTVWGILSSKVGQVDLVRSRLQVLHTGPIATHVVAIFGWLGGWLVGWSHW